MTTILVADDIYENRYFLMSMFRGSGYAILEASNGAEALEVALRTPPDLIVTDILMPVMDGFELCRRWKRDERLRNIPFTFYTATYTDPKDEQLALTLGADRFIVKPQNPQALLEVVREVLAEVQQRTLDDTARPLGDEMEVLRQYNEALFRKLEKKVLQLQAEIAERKQAEERVLESREFLDGIINAIGDPVFVKDEQSRFLLVNDALCRLVGRPRDALIGTTGADFLPPDQVERFLDTDRKVLSSGMGNLRRDQLATDDGKVVTIVTKKTLYVDRHGAKFVVGTVRDVTEHERLEEQLRAAQKMDAIGRLAGGVAHDFNNLLSVILSYTGLAIETLPEGDPRRTILVEVQRAGERAAELTRQLLVFSRKQVLQPVSLNLNQVAAGMEKMLRRILGEDIHYIQVLAQDLGLVRADPGQIEQVLMNLVVNARDAMPEGGTLTIETANVEIDEEYAARHVGMTSGSYVQIAVTDTGCGMDEQTKARLFEPFFTTKEKGKGTGLGLSTVYGIVTQSGGHIWVYSELGRGTTFKIYLPREVGTTAEVTRTSRLAAPATGTETILVVEDEEALRKVARTSLAAAGFTVLIAADGVEALETAARYEGEIHLLLTDVVMPKMSGHALAREIVKSRPGIKVLYMSGYTEDAVVHHGVLDERTQFIAKPFTGADLTRKVREVLDGGAPGPPVGSARAVETDSGLVEQPLEPAALGVLPADVLVRLRKAVIAARYGEILEIIEGIRATAPEVAARLRRMTDLFDYDGLRRLLDGQMERTRGE